MSTKHQRILLAVVGLAAAPGHLPGQAGAPPQGDAQRLRGVLEQLSPDARLRYETAEPSGRLEGIYLGLSDGSLLLGIGVDTVRTSTANIRRLWTRGRSTAKGAIIGGIAGLVLGALYGVAISEVTCAESSCTTLGLAAATGGVGAAGGAALGALVGLAIPRWKERFP